MTFLLYHCPTFRTDHLVEPCQKNMARVEALKVAKKHIGPLEKCVECKGKMLIKLPPPLKTVIEGPPAPKPYRQDWDPVPAVTTAPIFLKDEGKKEPEIRQLSPYPFIEPQVEVTRKPNWPEMRPLPPEKIAEGRAAVKRLAESHKLGKKPPKNEEIPPELPRKQEEPVPAVKITEKEAVKLGIVAADPVKITVDPPMEVRYCKTHPEISQQQDKLGRWMGMCATCVALRGQKCGIENARRGITAPPMAIPLNLPKYAELKAWLETQAEEGERKLQQQIMFVLKTAWRQGT